MLKVAIRFVLPMALALFLAAPASAQPSLLGEDQVTREALIQLLAPKDVPANASEMKPNALAAASPVDSDSAQPLQTRNIRPTLRLNASAAHHESGGRASVLMTFEWNSIDLSSKARQTLDIVASALKSDRLSGMRFTIEGHADPRGSVEYNLQLSRARADAVRSYLVLAHGLSPDQLLAVGKGASELWVPSDPTSPANRRVTILAQP